MQENLLNKNMFEVEVAGLPLRLRSSHDEATVQELVQLVNNKVQEVLRSAPQVSYQNALLLTSLHLAEDLIFLRRSTLTEIDRIENQTRQLISELESSPVSRVHLDV